MSLLRLNWSRTQIFFYLAGCIIFSVGAKSFIDSKLGTDPLDVLVLGIVKHTGLTIGITSGFVAIAFLIVWSIWNRTLPPITPFVTMFLVGNLIDLWNWLHLERYTTHWLNVVELLLVALFLAAYGSALIIMSGIGIRTMDLLAITIVHKWRWKLMYAKMMFEVGFLLSGWLLGGPVGIGTIAFVSLVGPGMILFMSLSSTLLGWQNFGLLRSDHATKVPF